MTGKNRKKTNESESTSGSYGHTREGAKSSTNTRTDSAPTLLKKPPKSSLQSRSKRNKPINYSSWVSGALGAVLAIVGSLYYSRKDWTEVHKFLHYFVCRDEKGYCHSALLPSRRTQIALRTIHKGEVVLQVPRSLQLWDLDAMRDEFVQQELFDARHANSKNPLESGAFLAAYLALRFQIEAEDDSMRSYLNILPTYEELLEYHPVLWTLDDLSDLESRSSSYAVAMGYQAMVASEYQAFTEVSTSFASKVSEKDYKTMRVHVLSRSFGTGPTGDEEGAYADLSFEDEIEMYRVKAGVDLKLGCHAMVPLLDMYNHHAVPNVEWRYDNSKRAFVVRAASGGIPGGYEVMDSYGKYTDSHLFAKFGFVNGDGSGHTQASIAAMHKPQAFGIRQFSYIPFSGPDEALKETMRQVMVRYLAFDDGYPECVEADKQPEAFELKRLKLEHLVRLANTPERWIYNVGPRNEMSRPGKTTEVPIPLQPPRFQKRKLGFNGRNIISTCRLIALHHEDFNGTAVERLRDGLKNETEIAFVGPDSDELEFRALMCLARLTGIKLMHYQTDEETELNKVRELNANAYQSRNWTIAHVRLGETQTLDVIRKMGLQGAKEKSELIRQKLAEPTDDFLPTFRTEQCPMEYSNALLTK